MPTFEARVNNNTHDGAWQTGQTPSNLIHTGGNLVLGAGGSPPSFEWNTVVHWLNVTVPQGAIIDVAFVRFVAAVTDSLNTILTNVHGVDEDNTAPSLIVSDATGKVLTAGVTWDNIPAWTDGEDGPDTQTPSLVAVIQAIVDRAGWVSGNAMQIQIRGDGSSPANVLRRPQAHNSVPAEGALLHIEWTTTVGRLKITSTIDSQFAMKSSLKVS